MKLLLSLIISAVCLYLALAGVDFSRAWRALSTIEWLWIIPAALVSLVVLWLKAERWRRLMLPLHAYSHDRSFEAYAVGQLANYLLPMRAGELVRVLVIARGQGGLSGSAALASVVSERVVDVATLLLLALLTMALFPTPAWVTYSCWVMLAVVAAALVALLVLRRGQTLVLRIAGAVERILPRTWQGRLGRMATSFIEGFVPLGSAAQYGWFLLETAAIWVLQGLVVYLMFLAFGLQASHHLGALAAMVTVVIVSLGAAVPSSPGMVGTFHLAVVVALTLCKVDKDTALSYAVMVHLLGVAVTYGAGLWALKSAGLGAGFFKGIGRQDKTGEAAAVGRDPAA